MFWCQKNIYINQAFTFFTCTPREMQDTVTGECHLATRGLHDIPARTAVTTGDVCTGAFRLAWFSQCDVVTILYIFLMKKR